MIRHDSIMQRSWGSGPGTRGGGQVRVSPFLPPFPHEDIIKHRIRQCFTLRPAESIAHTHLAGYPQLSFAVLCALGSEPSGVLGLCIPVGFGQWEAPAGDWGARGERGWGISSFFSPN